VRALALAAVLVVAAGCGGHGQRWPECLRILGVSHVVVATDAQLAKTPEVFDARRAAAVDFADGAGARIVVSATAEGAAKTAAALTSIPPIIDLPLPATSRTREVVLRRGTTVLAWFGRRGAHRQAALLDCAAS
jgi:hypothetical protein